MEFATELIPAESIYNQGVGEGGGLTELLLALIRESRQLLLDKK